MRKRTLGYLLQTVELGLGHYNAANDVTISRLFPTSYKNGKVHLRLKKSLPTYITEQKQLPLSTTSEKTGLRTAPGSQRIGEDCHHSQLPLNLLVLVPSKHLAQPLGGCPKHIIIENQLLLGASPALFFPNP